MSQTNQILSIIDGDALFYICSKDTLQESILNIDSLMQKILEKTGSTHYYLFLSESPYFRNEINKEYKSKRPISNLKYLKTLKNYLKEQYFAESWSKVEADDSVSYVQNQFLQKKLPQFSKTFICAIDKDVKKQVSGNIYDYKKDEFSTTTEEEALEFLHIQSIMGDSTDNIKGIPGVGEVKATKAIKEVRKELHSLAAYKQYINYYKTPGLALYEYQKNFRQVYILKTDEDFMNEVGYIPKLLNPIIINH